MGTLDIIHEELGVEEMADLEHVHRSDLKDTRSLKPVRRNKLIKCICALEDVTFEDMTLCPGRNEM